MTWSCLWSLQSVLPDFYRLLFPHKGLSATDSKLPRGLPRIAEKLQRCAAVLVQAQHLVVCQKRKRKRVVVPHFTAHDQRRAEDAPERHQRDLLRLREIRVVAPAVRRNGDAAQRQHVAVRILAGLHVRLPDLAAPEHLEQRRPVVPEIVGVD